MARAPKPIPLQPLSHHADSPAEPHMPLIAKLLILAMAAQVLLTMGILVWMGIERVPRVMSRRNPHQGHRRRSRRLSAARPAAVQQLRQPVPAAGAVLRRGAAGPRGPAAPAGSKSSSPGSSSPCAMSMPPSTSPPTVVHRRFAVYTAGLAVLAIFWLWLVLRLVVLPRALPCAFPADCPPPSMS